MDIPQERTGATVKEPATYRAYLVPIVALGALTLFLAAPWPLASKAYAALHGLCAQRPSHSLQLGGQTLPFDARMTGIYAGFLVTALYLAARGRYRAAAMPSWPAMAVLALFVGAMAVDGTNSLLLDLRVWHPYAPDNRLRLVTGLLTGIALAAVMAFLLAGTLWRRPRIDQAVVGGVGEVMLLAALQAPVAALALSGAGWLYGPIAVALLVSAATVLGSLMLVVVVLLRRAEGTFGTVRQVQESAAVAFLLGLLVMAGLAGGRFLLEGLTGAPPLT